MMVLLTKQRALVTTNFTLEMTSKVEKVY